MATRFAEPGACTVVGPSDIEQLVSSARSAPLGRARLCLHHGVEDPLHEMIIAFVADSYIPPHRHLGRTESFHLLQGTVVVVLFNDAGEITQRIRLSAESVQEPRVYRLQKTVWHTVVVLSQTAVLHEVTSGPFNPTSTETAPWAPRPDDPAAKRALIERCLSP